MRTRAIVLQQHPHFLLAVISALLSHPTVDGAPPLAPSTPAPEDKEGKRETGRTPEGNRCLRYPGFTYRQRRRRETGVQGRGNQYITGFCCLDLLDYILLLQLLS